MTVFPSGLPVTPIEVAEIRRLRPRYPKLQMFDAMLSVYAKPPKSPSDCIFAQTTECFSSDLERRIAPCQFGGNPDCSSCGCIASAGLKAVGAHLSQVTSWLNAGWMEA